MRPHVLVASLVKLMHHPENAERASHSRVWMALEWNGGHAITVCRCGRSRRERAGVRSRP